MPNRTEARLAKAARTHATGRLPLLRLFSTLLIKFHSCSRILKEQPNTARDSEPEDRTKCYSQVVVSATVEVNLVA